MMFQYFLKKKKEVKWALDIKCFFLNNLTQGSVEQISMEAGEGSHMRAGTSGFRSHRSSWQEAFYFSGTQNETVRQSLASSGLGGKGLGNTKGSSTPFQDPAILGSGEDVLLQSTEDSTSAHRDHST